MTLSRRTVLGNHAMLAFTAHWPDAELGLGKVVLTADGCVPSQTSVLASEWKGVIPAGQVTATQSQRPSSINHSTDQ